GGDGEGGGRQRGRGGRGEAALPSHGGQWRSRFHRGGAGLTAPAADRCWDDRVREYNITDGQGREKASSALRVFFIIMPSDGAPPAVPHSGSSGSYSNLLGDNKKLPICDLDMSIKLTLAPRNGGCYSHPEKVSDNSSSC